MNSHKESVGVVYAFTFSAVVARRAGPGETRGRSVSRRLAYLSVPFLQNEVPMVRTRRLWCEPIRAGGALRGSALPLWQPPRGCEWDAGVEARASR